MLETIVRSLRDRYTIDAVTNKGDCLDLLRQNTFEVIVAGERLEDGSGLELLGQVAKRWQSMLRIFSADPHRLELLRGRLGPFELFQVLPYPLDPDDLLDTLTLADAAQEADVDTADVQNVVLAGDMHFEEVDPFPAPQPEPRAAPKPEVRRTPPPARSIAAPKRSPQPQQAPAARSRARSEISVAAELERSESAARPTPVRFPARAVSPNSASALGPAGPTDLIEEVAAIAREARSSFGAPSRLGQVQIPRWVAGAAVGVVVFVVGLLALRGVGSRAVSPGVSTPVAPVQQPHPTGVAPPPPATGVIPPTPVGGSSVHRLAQPAPQPVTHSPISHRRTDAASSRKHDSQEAGAAVATDSKPMIAAAGGSPAAGSTAPALPPETPVGMSAPSGPPPDTAPTASAPVDPPRAPDSSSSTPVGSVSAEPAAAAVAAPVADSPPASGSTEMVRMARPVPPASNNAPTALSDEPPPVIREAKLIHEVSADYPSAARRDGIEGSVDLDATVSPQGIVTNVSVTHSEPQGIFDKAAVHAVRRYRYDPQFQDGLPVEAHVQVHLTFKPGMDGR